MRLNEHQRAPPVLLCVQIQMGYEMREATTRYVRKAGPTTTIYIKPYSTTLWRISVGLVCRTVHAKAPPETNKRYVVVYTTSGSDRREQ